MVCQSTKSPRTFSLSFAGDKSVPAGAIARAEASGLEGRAIKLVWTWEGQGNICGRLRWTVGRGGEGGVEEKGGLPSCFLITTY